MREILKTIGILAAAIAMIIVVRLRRRSHTRFLNEFSDQEVCPHLQAALSLLKSRGHYVTLAGQLNSEMPLEIHLFPPFDPQKLAEELKLVDPVLVSDRNVLYCKEDWCELHPR